MSSDQPTSPWGPADISTVGPDGGARGAVPGRGDGGGGPRKRWPYVVLIAVGLVLMAGSGVVIALNLTGTDDQVATSESGRSSESDDQTATTDKSDSSKAKTSEDGSEVTLPDRTDPSSPRVNDDGPSPGGSSGAVSGGGDHSVGEISFDLPPGFAAIVVEEPRDDGALRSEFENSTGQQIVIEINPDDSSDGFDTAQELAANFRDQGRLIHEPYSDQVGGHTTGVLAIRGSSGDYRSDHFLSYAGYGMAVMGIDPSSFDAADSLAQAVLPTLQD